MGDAMVLLAQVSDLHIDGGEKRTARAERVMGYLAALPRPVDAVLVTGDVADHGQPAEYETARELLGDPGGEGPVNQVHRLDGVTVLLCDSTVPGQDGGYLDDQTIGWLDAALAAAADRPALVAMHHPPVALGVPFIDDIRQAGGGRLADVVRRHDHVVAVLCGHAHTAASTWFAGRQLLVAPGVASTLLLNDERPTGDVLDGDAPAAIAFHLLDGDRLTTHFRVVG